MQRRTTKIAVNDQDPQTGIAHEVRQVGDRRGFAFTRLGTGDHDDLQRLIDTKECDRRAKRPVCLESLVRHWRRVGAAAPAEQLCEAFEATAAGLGD